MRLPNAGRKEFLLIFLLAVGACSTKRGGTLTSADLQPTTQTGAVVGAARVSLGSGDVKALAFKPTKLVQQGYAVLSDVERQDIVYDVDQGIEARRLAVISGDELDRKTRAKVAAMESFQRRLPEKEAIPAVATATTDASGSFKFDRIQAGTYWVFLDTQVAGNFVGWAVRVEVRPGTTTRVDLDNTDLDYGFR